MVEICAMMQFLKHGFMVGHDKCQMFSPFYSGSIRVIADGTL